MQMEEQEARLIQDKLNLSEDEVRLAEEAGMKICSLGPRILRCETAPLCALSAVLYAAGALE